MSSIENDEYLMGLYKILVTQEWFFVGIICSVGIRICEYLVTCE